MKERLGKVQQCKILDMDLHSTCDVVVCILWFGRQESCLEGRMRMARRVCFSLEKGRSDETEQRKARTEGENLLRVLLQYGTNSIRYHS